MAVGYFVGGETRYMMIAFLVALATNAFALLERADKMVLGMYRAREVTRWIAKPRRDLYDIVAQLAARAHLPMPKVYVIESDQPNAFATGRNPEHAAVAATTGLLRILDEREIARRDRPRTHPCAQPRHPCA